LPLLSRFDDRNDLRLDCFRQVFAGVDDLGKGGVDRPEISRKCTGFCSAASGRIP
jgi:hypothetical protein